jgi:hypothetical protein
LWKTAIWKSEKMQEGVIWAIVCENELAAVQGSCPEVVLIHHVLLSERLNFIHLFCLALLIYNILWNFVGPVPVPLSYDLTFLLNTVHILYVCMYL